MLLLVAEQSGKLVWEKWRWGWDKFTYMKVVSLRRATILETKVLCLTFILSVDIPLLQRKNWENNLQCRCWSSTSSTCCGNLSYLCIMACSWEHVISHRKSACLLARLQIINNFHFNMNIKQLESKTFYVLVITHTATNCILSINTPWLSVNKPVINNKSIANVHCRFMCFNRRLCVNMDKIGHSLCPWKIAGFSIVAWFHVFVLL